MKTEETEKNIGLLEAVFSEEPKSPDGATSSDLFGRFLFAPERVDTPKPKEPNNSQEMVFQSRLDSFFGGEPNALGPMANQALALARQGKYKRFLVPDKGSLAYRFMSVGVDHASKMLGLPKNEIVNSPVGQAFYVSGTPVYKPRNKFSSWTLDPQYNNMGEFAYGNGEVSLVLVAKTDENNFLLNPVELSKVGAWKKINDAYHIEAETIGVGLIKTFEAAYMVTENLSGVVENTLDDIITDLADIFGRLTDIISSHASANELKKTYAWAVKKHKEFLANPDKTPKQDKAYRTVMARNGSKIKTIERWIEAGLTYDSPPTDRETFRRAVWDMQDELGNFADMYLQQEENDYYAGASEIHKALMNALRLKSVGKSSLPKVQKKSLKEALKEIDEEEEEEGCSGHKK